ncbi:hypothetical protein BH11VER1_BH11VER1_07760 [soil metagenome]
MNMNADLHLLAVRYLDDAMPANERAAYVERLRTDVAARYALQDASQQAVTLAEMMLARPKRRSAFEPIPGSKILASRGAWPLALAATVVVLAGIASLMWPLADTGTKDGLVTVKELFGSVRWRGGAGEVRELRSRDVSVAAGTFLLEDEMSQLEFVFHDGTRISLRGPAELVVAEDGQKRLHLRSGAMVADVVKQPEGFPMIVRTPTAEGIVLGTRFELSAATERTSLAVDHGLVQLRRLADNQTMQVSDQRMGDVSRDTTSVLSSRALPNLRSTWRSDLFTPPEENWRGDWLEPEGTLPGRMLAVGKMSEKSKMVHYRVVVRAQHGPLVSLSRETTVRVRFRMLESAPMELFMCTSTNGGLYAGNYQISLRPDPANPTKDGWSEITLPLSSFKRIDAQKITPQPEALRFFYISTFERDAGLEVATLEITTP